MSLFRISRKSTSNKSTRMFHDFGNSSHERASDILDAAWSGTQTGNYDLTNSLSRNRIGRYTFFLLRICVQVRSPGLPRGCKFFQRAKDFAFIFTATSCIPAILFVMLRGHLICLLWCRVKSCFPVESQSVIRFFPLLLLLRFAMHCISSYLHHISQEREAASFFTCMRALTLKFVRNHRDYGAELKVCSTHNFGLI